MRVWRRCASVLILAGILFGATGCWDAVPVEDTAFTTAIAFDLGDEPETPLIMTDLIVRPQLVGGGEQGAQRQGAAKPYFLASLEVPTEQFYSFLESSFVAERVRLDHIAMFLISDEVAKRHSSSIIAWGLRHHQIRPSIDVVISRGAAQRVLDVQPPLEFVPTRAIRGLLSNVELSAVAVRVSLLRFARDLLDPYRDAMAPLVVESNLLKGTAEAGFEQAPLWTYRSNEDLNVEVIGMAVYRGENMAGALTQQEALGLTYLLGASLATIDFRHPRNPTVKGAASFITLKPRIKPSVDSETGRLSLQIRFQGSGELLEAGVLEMVAGGPILTEVEREIEKNVENLALRAMKKLQLLRSDPLGVREILYSQDPRTWKVIKGHWEELYAEAELDITADIKILKTAEGR